MTICIFYMKYTSRIWRIVLMNTPIKNLFCNTMWIIIFDPNGSNDSLSLWINGKKLKGDKKKHVF